MYMNSMSVKCQGGKQRDNQYEKKSCTVYDERHSVTADNLYDHWTFLLNERNLDVIIHAKAVFSKDEEGQGDAVQK